MIRSLEMFERARARTLDLLSGLSQAQVDFSSAPGRWSIGELADHLILGEKLYRDQIAELIAMAKEGRTPLLRLSTRDVNFSPVFLPKTMLPLFEVPFTLMNLFVPATVREYLTRHVVIPAQHPDSARPRKGRAVGDLARELADSIRRTRALLESNSGLDYSRMAIDHPLLGRNTVPELLRVAALHEQRHQDQIVGIRNNSRFPNAA